MESFKMRLLLLSMGILLVSCKPENPLANVNLSPFWQWRSAWDCMQNTSQACKWHKDVLNLTGILNVSNAEIGDYCDNGCAKHTQTVLTCISYVKRNFVFSNGATVHYINDTITKGCAIRSSLNTTTYKSSATRTFQSFLVPLITSLATASIVAIFNI